MLREVKLEDVVSGHLYLYNMPGRIGYGRTFQEDDQLISDSNLDYIICLADLGEIERKSPDYAQAITTNMIKWERKPFPIIDYGVPDKKDLAAFLKLVRQAAEDLQDGKRILIHCSAGYGRTGTVAICILVALGIDQSTAYHRVRAAGSNPEQQVQRELIDWVEENYSDGTL